MRAVVVGDAAFALQLRLICIPRRETDAHLSDKFNESTKHEAQNDAAVITRNGNPSST